MGKLIKIGVNFTKKKLNPTLKDWKNAGYTLIWKPYNKSDETLVRSDIEKFKQGKYRKTHLRKIKKRYYDVYIRLKK